jgi:hypothetical protein
VQDCKSWLGILAKDDVSAKVSLHHAEVCLIQHTVQAHMPVSVGSVLVGVCLNSKHTSMKCASRHPFKHTSNQVCLNPTLKLTLMSQATKHPGKSPLELNEALVKPHNAQVTQVCRRRHRISWNFWFVSSEIATASASTKRRQDGSDSTSRVPTRSSIRSPPNAPWDP